MGNEQDQWVPFQSIVIDAASQAEIEALNNDRKLYRDSSQIEYPNSLTYIFMN